MSKYNFKIYKGCFVRRGNTYMYVVFIKYRSFPKYNNTTYIFSENKPSNSNFYCVFSGNFYIL